MYSEDDIDLKEALRATLRLFSDLYRKGLTHPAGERMRRLREFQDVLPSDPDDKLEVRHETLFGFNVFPLGSVFLDDQQYRQNQTLDFLLKIRKEADLSSHDASEPFDHISTALSFLASCDDEVLLSRFIDSYLLGWLPILECAIRAHDDVFYSRLSLLTLMLICDMRKSVSISAVPPVLLPERESCILDDENNGIREIAEFLVTPARCGIFLSRRSIRQLGNETKIVSGFGRRSSMMLHVLESAAMYGEFSHLVNEIRRYVSVQKSSWEEFGESCVGTAPDWAKRWLSVLEGTEETLGGLKEALE
jgi:Nitrate reductase delta subunit